MVTPRQINDYVQLREAIRRKDKARAQSLILSNVNVNNPKLKCNTPLHWAITQFDDLDIMKMLLDRGANVHAKNHRNLKPLEFAIQNSKTKAAILLIEKGALVGEDLNALLTEAIQKNNQALFKSLFKNRTQYNQTVNFDILFKSAISRGNPKMIKQIIPHCQFSKPSERYIPRKFVLESQYKDCVELLLNRNFTVSPNSNHDTDFVYSAVKNSHLQIFVQLLKLGIDVNLVNLKTKLNLLKIACLNKHYIIVKLLLKHNAFINVTTPTDVGIFKRRYYYDMRQYNRSLLSMYCNDDLWGLTCLHIAVLNSDPVMTRLLLSYGAKIIDDLKFFNVACIAVQINCEEILSIFLDHGVDVNDTNAQGESLLYFCVDIDFFEPDSRYNIAELLLNRGATTHIQSPSNSVFFTAMKNGHRKIAQLFLENNANIQYISPDGDTPLHKAIEKEYDAEFIKTLLKLKAPVNAVNNCLLTPLLVACKTQSKNQLDVIKTLVHYNANVNFTVNSRNTDRKYRFYSMDKEGQTPLHFICKHKSDMTASIIELLLEHNANIEAVDSKGWTPIFYACSSSNDVAVKCLLNHHANANHMDLENLTPLYIASQQNRSNSKVVKLLLEHKVNVHCMDQNRNSIIHAIAFNGKRELINCFAHTQVNFNSINKDGDTPLQVAVSQERVNMTKSLIKYGANVNILDKKNRTPLQNAIRSMLYLQNLFEKYRERQYSGERHSDDEGWDIDTFRSRIDPHKKIIKVLKMQVVKLKSAGLKVNKRNLNIINNSYDYAVNSDESSDNRDMDYRPDIQQFEMDCEKETEKMRMERISVNDMTLYDLLKKNVHILSRFVKNKKIQQTIELEVYDEKFPLYIDIVRSRFRDAKLRYRLMNSAINYFSANIDQRLSDDCIDAVFSYLNLKEIKMFIRAMKPVDEFLNRNS